MRPDLQLFLHVVGAIGLFGATGSVAVFGIAGARGALRPPLATASLLTTIALGVPAWVLMLVFGSWTKSKEGVPDSASWLSLGSGIAGAGIAVLLATAALAYWWMRRPASSWAPLGLAVVSSLYLVALGVAWWAMSAKVPS